MTTTTPKTFPMGIKPSNDSLQLSVDENKENITLIWFDPNIGKRDDTKTTMKQLREINDYVIFHTELEQCLTHILSIRNEKIFLITSGVSVSDLLSHISTISQIDSIFIYCMKEIKYQHLLKTYSKIIGIYTDLHSLCISIREQIDGVEKQLATFSYFDQRQKSTKDLSKQSAEFLWFQLFNYVMLRLPHSEQAKKQMLELCRHYYRGNFKQLQLIEEFDCNYEAERAIEWYSKESFVYKLVNKALRSEDIDQLYTFRFFIADLSKSLAREHQKVVRCGETILTVYRGLKLSHEELQQLKENQGKLISTNGYLSTSRLRQKAFDFAIKPTKRSDAFSTLFEINCDIQKLPDDVVFADISQFSVYPDEEEVLFDLSAVFRLEDIEFDGQIWLIRMSVSGDGKAITQDYIEVTRRETSERTETIIFGTLLCQMGLYDKYQRYFEQLLADPNDEDVAWIEFNIGRALHYQGELKRAREFYDQAYDRMMSADPPRIKDSAYVLNTIGNILNTLRFYDNAFQCYERALKIRRIYYPDDHPDTAISLKNLASVLEHQGKYDEALDCCQQALSIQNRYYPTDHPSIAWSLDSTATILHKQGKCEEALDLHRQALEKKEKYYPANHPDFACSLNSIGEVLQTQEKYDEALDCFQRALSIQETSVSLKQPAIVWTLNNIGQIFQKQEKHDEALILHQRALRIQEECSPDNHPAMASCLNNIGNGLQSQEKYVESLDFFLRALNIQENYDPNDHPDIAVCLNNIATSYEKLNKTTLALNYYKRALAVYEKNSTVEHQLKDEIEENICKLSSEQ